MAIAAANLSSIVTATDGVAYTFAGADYDANSLILLSFYNSKAAAPDEPTAITGLIGATWDKIETVTIDTVASPTGRINSYRTMIPSSQTGVAVVVSYGVATQTGFAGSIDQVTDCATSGSNGSGAVMQSTFYSTGGNQTISITLPTAISTATAIFGIFGKGTNSAMGDPAGYTQLFDGGAATPAKRIQTVWDDQTTGLTISSTQPANSQMGAIMLEIRSRSAVTATSVGTRRLLTGVGV